MVQDQMQRQDFRADHLQRVWQLYLRRTGSGSVRHPYFWQGLLGACMGRARSAEVRPRTSNPRLRVSLWQPVSHPMIVQLCDAYSPGLKRDCTAIPGKARWPYASRMDLPQIFPIAFDTVRWEDDSASINKAHYSKPHAIDNCHGSVVATTYYYDKETRLLRRVNNSGVSIVYCSHCTQATLTESTSASVRLDAGEWSNCFRGCQSQEGRAR